MSNALFDIATVVIPMILAIVFHEVAHGWTARALGDPTAAEMKRLSLNPLRHVDPIGTIVVPGVLKLVGMPVFGWANPVPVNFARLRNPRVGMMLVAAAGPGTNLVLGAVGAVLLGMVLRVTGGFDGQHVAAAFIIANLLNFLVINVFLALFNLLPLPPFDGSHIVEGLLPPGAAQAYARLRPIGFPLVIALLVVLPTLIPGFNLIERFVVPPVNWAMEHYLGLAGLVAGRDILPG